MGERGMGWEPVGGKGGIRTLGTGEPVRRISNPVHSTTLPPFRGSICGVEIEDASVAQGLGPASYGHGPSGARNRARCAAWEAVFSPA